MKLLFHTVCESGKPFLLLIQHTFSIEEFVLVAGAYWLRGENYTKVFQIRITKFMLDTGPDLE